MNLKFHADSGVCTVSVRVVPGARKTAIVGSDGEFLRIRVAAPPADGKANQALIEFLAQLLTLPKTSIEIKSGFASKQKVVQLKSCDPEKMRTLLIREVQALSKGHDA